MKKILSLLLVVAVLMTIFVGCGGKNVEGKWESAYIEATGEISGKFKMPGEFGFELQKGGKFVSEIAGSKAEGTWKLNGDKVTITVSGDTSDLKVENDLLIWDYPGFGGKIYFTKDLKNFKFPDDVKDFEF